ncbi:RHS repeat-associated core domain-containing protein [Sorangium sp. So ce429]
MGRVTEIRDRASTVELTYDPCGRLVARSFSDGRRDEISYDLLGRMECVTSGDITCEYTRDARGRVVRETVTRGDRRTTTETAYDALGKAVRTSGPFGAMAITRDVVGRAVGVSFGDAGPLRLGYDAAGNLVERALPAGGRIAEEVTPDGLLARVKVTSPKAGPAMRPGEPAWVGPRPLGVTFAHSYGWSSAGLLGVVADEAGGRTVELPRDVNGLVVARQRAEGPRREVMEGFSHGPSGELHDSEAQRRYGPGGRLLARGGVTFRYDDGGRVTSKTAADGRSWRFDWGDGDLLQAVWLPDGRVVRFVYDPFARRLEKRVEKDRIVESVTRYAWSGDALVHEVRARVARSGDPVVEERAYAVLPEAVLPLADRVQRGEHDQVRYYVGAPNGMPEALVTADGELVGPVEASLFGHVEDEQAGLTPLRFAGQYADEETGLYYNRYRYYDPEPGQYLSPEPIRLEGSLRAYAYAEGRPMDAVDLDALAAQSVIYGPGPAGNRPVLGRGESGGSMDDLHPAVHAALPPVDANTARQNDSRGRCAEPHALSNYLNEWEWNGTPPSQRTGAPPRSCRPGDPAWQQNLGNALSGIDQNEGIVSGRRIDQSNPGNEKRWPACENCSQMIPRLYTLAGMTPPNNVVATGTAGGHTGPAFNPSTTFTSNPANAAYFNHAAPPPGGPAALGTWEHRNGQWTRSH